MTFNVGVAASSVSTRIDTQQIHFPRLQSLWRTVKDHAALAHEIPEVSLGVSNELFNGRGQVGYLCLFGSTQNGVIGSQEVNVSASAKQQS